MITDTAEKVHLAPHHLAMLTEGSGISAEVLDARGAFTAPTPAEMAALGFAPNQCRAPALILPMYDQAGQCIGYVARPDTPREDTTKAGKLIKYEYPARHALRLDVPPTPTNLAQLRDPTVPLIVTEGIRKADSAVSRGACALTLSGVWAWITKGVSLPDWDTIPVRGRQVYLAFDSDVMEKPEVYQAMQGLGSFLTVLGARPRYVYLPPGIDGAKVGLDDFFVQGHTLTDVWRCAEETLRDAPEEKARARPCITSMDTVEKRPIDWLWWPYLAIGKISMLDGDPGIGKSMLTLQLAACLSRDFPLPDQQGTPTLPVGGVHTTLMLSAEDALDDTVRPRLDAAGADASRVKVLTGWLGKEDEERAFTLQHMDVLEQAVKETRPRLVIIDPIQNVIGDVDMSRANETRPIFTALKTLAEKYRFAVVCVRHPSKPGQNINKVMYRGLGGMDFIGVARAGLFVEQHPGDPGKALLAHFKSNTGQLGRTHVFSKAEGNFQWCGVSRLTAEMLAGSGRGPDPHAFLEVVLWLEKELSGGIPQSAKDLEDRLEDEGFKRDTIRRAKKALGIVSLRRGGVKDSPWDWKLPDLSLILPPLQLQQPLQSLQSLQHLKGNQGLTDIPTEGAVDAEDVVETEDTEVTAVAYARAPVLESLPSMGSRCPDGRSHNWIRRGELPRLCCQCNAEEVPA